MLLLVLAASVGCSVGDDSPQTAYAEGAITVPNLVGMKRRAVEELLADRSLRWGQAGSDAIESKPPPANMWSTADDDFITEQSPSPGTKVARGTVIRIKTSCSMEPLPEGAICLD